MELTKKEITDINKYGYEVSIIRELKEELIIDDLIVLSHGNRKLHDSGYPLIKIIGFSKGTPYSLGYHDHFLINVPVNIDSFGKNIFHIMTWANKQGKTFHIRKGFISCSTFEIGTMFPKDDKYIELR